MERRSWPWKRKSHDKVAVIPISTDSSPSRSCKGKDTPKSLKEHLQKSDVPKLEIQPSGECNDLNRKLSAALENASAKETLIQQHKKLAEDAVSGWEKAQKEIVSLKQQMHESEIHKLDFLRKIAQLGGALTELRKELHEVKHEQDKKIQSAIMENDKIWTTMSKEFETKFSRASHQLLKAEAEKNALLKLLQEAKKTSSELHHSNSVTEAEAKGHRAKAEALASENSALKLHAEKISKELLYCNEQRERDRNETDSVKRRYLECLKRMEKLEAECQKLRISLRQKVTSASLPMFWRLEMESQKKNSAERKKKHSIESAGLQGTESNEISTSSASGEHGSADLGASDKLLALEEEAKMLKESLTKRNNELQAARLMCARTAGKLSQVEEHLDVVQGLQKYSAKSASSIHSSSDPASLLDRTSNEVYSAEAWAAALVTELAQFKKDRISTINDNFSEISDFELMDDFVEMEQIASRTAPLSSPKNALRQSKEAIISSRNVKSIQGRSSTEDEKTEFKQANMELTKKLALAEEKLNALRLKNISSAAAVVHLQQKLDAVSAKAQSEGISMEILFEKGTNNSSSQVAAVWNSPGTGIDNESSRAHSRLNCCNDESVNSFRLVKSQHEDQFTSTVLKILHFLELLIHITARPEKSSPNYVKLIPESHGIAFPLKQRQQGVNGTSLLENSELTIHSKRLLSITCSIVQRKTDILDFVTELSLILEIVVAKAAPTDEPFQQRIGKRSNSSEDVEEETKDMLVPVVFQSKMLVNESFYNCGEPEYGTLAKGRSTGANDLIENFSLQDDKKTEMASFVNTENQKIKMQGDIFVAKQLLECSSEDKLKQLAEKERATTAFWKKEHNYECKETEERALNPTRRL